MVVDYTNKIKGLKFSIKGKLKGKPRKKKLQILVGNVPCQQIKHPVDFAKTHVYNRYGAFGLKF